ncbi:hypothetical protein [Microbacterium istanbulense]|uniref:Uncharacterized protein n=1 Tax=Microbacterium istanbulense TaxID=3122049 RepID=A0ABU8LJZ3_9MICO
MAGSIAAVLALGIAGGGGYLAGRSSVPDVVPATADPQQAQVAAVSNPAGDVENLDPQEAEQFAENSTPIAEEDVQFEENIDLTVEQIADRTEEMADAYEVGEPLSPEDLEFLRAYMVDESVDSGPTVTTANYSADSDEPNIELAASTTGKINRSKTAFGTSVSQVGSFSLKVGEPNPFANSWSTSFTAKKTSGTSLTKIKAQVNVQGYGAVTQWPFVGKVYETSQSSTSGANVQSWSFNRSGSFGGVILNLEIQTYAYFWNSKGSFQLP